MADPNAALRRLLADWEVAPDGAVWSHQTAGSPRPEAERQSTPGVAGPVGTPGTGGVDGRGSGRHQPSATTTPTAATAPVGTVVLWRTARSAGVGQVVSFLTDGRVMIRPFLPTASKELFTSPELLVVLPDLSEAVTAAYNAAQAR